VAATRLAVRVSPGAASAGIVGRHGEAWKLRVAAPPERGKANAAVVRLVAGVAGVSDRDVRVVSGHGTRDKILELTGIDPSELEERLDAAGRNGS
jgi:uncharacterized protein (TIGR00251 family)